MGFSCTRFAAIAICLTSIVVLSFSELVVLRHPPTNNGNARNLTCVSEDDDAALIWNYNIDPNTSLSGQNIFTITDFEPKKRMIRDFPKCALWNLTACVVDWGINDEWIVVDSTIKPMGPVFDYRWEGLKEYVFEGTLELKNYQYVSKVKEFSGSAVFSARGLRNIDVYLCDSNVPYPECVWVIIGDSGNRKSTMHICLKEVLEPRRLTNITTCKIVATAEHGPAGVIDPYEWRTFKIEWDSDKKVIRVYKITEDVPFLEVGIAPWISISHLYINSELSARMRFHFYEYHLTEKKGSVLSTGYFHQYGVNFCVKLLVHLCPKCVLEIHVMDVNNETIVTRRISWPQNFPVDGPVVDWRPLQLNTVLPNFTEGLIRLMVRPILDEGDGGGRWAIDNFHTCESGGSLRKSTITIRQEERLNSPIWPRVNCQKLSYDKTAVVDTLSIHRINDNTKELRQLLRDSRKGCEAPQCKTFGENSSFCNPTGCTCDERLKGSNCTDTPGKVRRLLARNVFDTVVTLQWSAPWEINGIITKYTVSIKLITLLGCEKLGRPTPPQNETLQEVISTTASFSGLHPYAKYQATVIAYTSKAGPAETITFPTMEAKIPTSVVSNLTLDHEQRRLDWDQPLDCTTISGPIDVKKLVLTITSGPKSHSTSEGYTANDYYYVSNFGLDPYTSYKVRVHVVRDWLKPENSDLYQEIKWKTAPPAPSRVEIIELFDADFDTRTISLRWKPPNPANGELQSYRVLIEKGEAQLIDQTIKVSEGVCEQWTNYVCFKNFKLPRDIATSVQLQIFAKYKDVKQLSPPGYLIFEPATAYIERPGTPLNLTVSREGEDLVTLEWKPPPFSPTKILQFRILVEVLETFLLEYVDTQFPMVINYTVREEQEEYSAELRLIPSTKYRISVVSVNGRNIISRVTEKLSSMPGYVGFRSKEEPEVKRNGSLIEVKIPQVVNATRNTFVRIIVQGPSTCTPHRAQTSSSRVNPTIFVEEWEAAVYKVEKRTPEPLEIFAKQHHGVRSDCSLHLEETYTILFIVKDWYSGASANFTSSKITLINRELSQGTNLAWLIIFPIIAVSLLLLFVWHRKCKSVLRQQKEPSYLDVIPLHASTISQNNLAILDTAPDSISLHGAYEIPSSTPLYDIPNEPDSCSVSLKYFEEYAKGAAASGRLHSQFMLLSRGLTKPCDYGSLPENVPKNRYQNLIAYDHSRVVLEKIPGDPYSDYINASYIKGYRKERTYIAAQGPKPNTVNDFWRMIWQEDVRVICMLVNVGEGVTTMCEKYWPDVGTRVKYGEFLISNTSNQVFAHYTFRTFKLSYRQDTREVTHLHYTGWPIIGVPSSQSLVEYIKKLFQTPTGNGPVVVHCDTGDGRTGTVILCDICRRQAIAERIIDVTAVITRMRDSRANMVGTPQQYLLAHIIISESIVSIPTKIACTANLPEEIQRLRQQLPNDLKRLNDTMWHQEALDSFADLEPLDELVSESDAVINRTDVSRTMEKKSNQISAVTVDGVRTKNQYLASWLPPPLTLINFWKFIAEEKIKLIIILQCSDPKNPTCRDIFPDERILLSMPHIQLENKSSPDEGEYFTTEKLLLTDTSENNTITQSVTVLTCKGWDCGKTRKPPPPAALVSLWEASERIPREAGQTLVLCHDGITGCGLYLALSFVLERMAVDRECDVISAVRTVRRSMPEIVQSKEQCEYLYDAAETYAEYFKHYANFT